MPRPKNPVPTYRLHKQSGQAICTVNVNGTRKDILLGVYGSPESKTEYQRVLTDLAAGRLATGAPADLTVNELCNRFWKHAQEYYRHPGGTATTEATHFRYAIRVFRETVGDMPAREFGPLAFKRVREKMVERKWARKTVNAQGGRVKRIVRWGVENELLPADRWEALRAVRGLASGRTSAPDREPVAPVEDEHLYATLPHLNRQLVGLVLFMRFTGCRPAEACRLRMCDVDRSGVVWLYRPEHHKTRHKGKNRVVPIGPRAQALLSGFTTADPTSYVFNPKLAVEEGRADRAAKRKTPRYPSHMKRNANKRKASPQRVPGERYTTHAVDTAVARSIELVPHLGNGLSRKSKIPYLARSLDCEETDKWQGRRRRSS